jgi:hypothetical protein
MSTISPPPPRSRPLRRASVAAVVALSVLAVLLGATASGADEVDDALASEQGRTEVQRLDGDRWVIPFRATEIGAALRLSGATSESIVTLPVINGTEPVALRAMLTVSPDVDSGYLEYQGPGVQSRLLDFAGLGGRPVDQPVELDLRGMQPTNGQLRLTIRSRLRSTDPGCVTSLLGEWAELREGGLVLEGTEVPPSSVASFLPKLLERLTIAVPTEPTTAESTAALRIALYAQRSAIGRNPQVEVVRLESAAAVPDVPFVSGERTVVVSDAAEPGARVVPTPAGGVVLVVGGDPQDMDRTSDALVSRIGRLAVGGDVDVERFDPDGLDGAVPEGLPPADTPEEGDPTTTTIPAGLEPGDPSLRDTEFTFDDLGLGGERVTGLGRLELPISIDQASLGGPTSSVNLEIVGALTPIAKGADATMSVLVDGVMVQSVNLADFEGEEDPDGVVEPGRFTVDAEIPEDMLGRTASVTILVDYSPAGGECRPGDIPFMFQVDPVASKLVIDPGQGLPPGFERFPQTLLPDFQVALDRYDTDRLELSLRLVMALQRVAPVALDGTYTSIDDAIESDRAAVLVAEGTPDLLAAAPLLSTDPMSLTDGQRVERLRLDVDQPYAVLEAFDLQNADRLLLTWSGGVQDPAAGWAQADDLVAEISRRDQTFADLFGDTYLVSVGSPPLNIALRDDAVQSTPELDSPDYLGRAKPLLLAALVAAAVVAVMAWIRRRRAGRSESEEREPQDLGS